MRFFSSIAFLIVGLLALAAGYHQIAGFSFESGRTLFFILLGASIACCAVAALRGPAPK